MLAKLIAAVLPLAAAVTAQHQVLVGVNGTLSFFPSSIQVAANDNITFVFLSKNHTINQGSFDEPCTHLPGGLEAPFNQVVGENQTDHFPTITISVQDTTPLWINCPQPGPPPHCQLGMVFAINPTKDQTAEQFRQNAVNSARSSSGSVSSTGSGTNVVSNSPSGSNSSSPNSSFGSDAGSDADPNDDGSDTGDVGSDDSDDSDDSDGLDDSDGSDDSDDIGGLNSAAHYKASAAMGLLTVVASGMLLL